MAERIFIIHGWDGYPEEGWFPWLKKELEARGFTAVAPAMPNPRKPTIPEWVSFLQQRIGIADEQTFLVGHSMGAQAILRYLETLDGAERVSLAMFVAGPVTLTPAAYVEEGDEETAKPWLETPIDWGKVRLRAKKFIAIFSDNDPFVPLADADIFRQQLDAEIIIEHGKGHFSGSDGITELPSALAAVLKHAAAG